MKLRTYQIELSQQASEILKRLHIVYLAFEVRTGKTLTALNTAQLYGAKNVLFLTKKKAISSIQNDYKNFGFNFKLTVINNESAHKFIDKYDLVISDEHHRNGAYPKPNGMTKFIKKHYSKLPMIFLSGTPHPESYSQIYHQFWCSDYSPFKTNSFYHFFRKYDLLKVKEPKATGYPTNDYSLSKEKLLKQIEAFDYPKEIEQQITDVLMNYQKKCIDFILQTIKPYMITFTQAQAGFETKVIENVLKVKMQPLTYQLANKLKRDKFIIAKDGSEIMADTAVKEMQKLHQIYSGTVLFEDKTSRIFDLSKAEFICDKFKGKKIGIFYKFKAEYDALKQVFKDQLTNDLDEFNTANKNIALQIVSGSEGISLRNADYLVYYNIDFSAKNYWQSRDRLTTMQRKSNDVYWIFSEGGIEEKIYKQVMNKKNFTSSVFKQLYK